MAKNESVYLNFIEQGLEIKAKIDKKIYELGNKILEKEFKKINLKKHKINPIWNYTLSKI